MAKKFFPVDIRICPMRRYVPERKKYMLEIRTGVRPKFLLRILSL